MVTPNLCVTTSEVRKHTDSQRVPVDTHICHACRQPRHPCAHPTVTRTSVHVCACILGPALRAPAATLAALAASCMRACVQQDATGALGTCIRTRMRARQTHAEERGGKGGPRHRHTLDAPVALEYLPATHRVHVAADDEDDSRGPYLPAAHAEPEHVADPSAAYLPATQSVHSEAPAVQAQRQTARSSRDILRYKRMRAVAYTRSIARFLLLGAQHCLAVRYDGYL